MISEMGKLKEEMMMNWDTDTYCDHEFDISVFQESHADFES